MDLGECLERDGAFIEENIKTVWCYCVSGILEMQEEERGKKKASWGLGWGGQGRNMHSEAQIDAKQLLNSCKVEQLLGRRGARDGGDGGRKDQVGETERPRGHVEILD